MMRRLTRNRDLIEARRQTPEIPQPRLAIPSWRRWSDEEVLAVRLGINGRELVQLLADERHHEAYLQEARNNGTTDGHNTL